MSSFENKVATQIGQLQLNIFQLQTQLEAKNAVLIDVQKKAVEKEKHMTEAYEELVAENAGLRARLEELLPQPVEPPSAPSAPSAPPVDDLGDGNAPY